MATKKVNQKKTSNSTKKGIAKPSSKGITTFCAKNVGVEGRRKSDGSQKKNYKALPGGKLKKTIKK